VVEADPKAGNLFQRYRPDEPAKATKGKVTRRCGWCEKRILIRNWDRHVMSKGHIAKLK